MALISPRLNFKGPILLGYSALFLLVFGVGGWSALTPISGAVMPSGVLEVEGNRQVVQHIDGGVIKAIYVRDGDKVEEGQVLVELDGVLLHPQLNTVEGQWFEIVARKDRLSAVRDGLPAIVFDSELELRKADPAISDLIAAQVLEFEAGRTLQAQEADQLRGQQVQIGELINGLIAQSDAYATQLALTEEDLEGKQKLLEQGLIERPRVVELQRNVAELTGSLAQVKASIAENRAKISEVDIALVQLESKAREAAIAELRELEFTEIELRANRTQLIDQIARLEMRAPSSGIVYGSTVDTPGGVIQPAQTVLYVVPMNAQLVVKAKIEITDIDQVHIGQDATLSFSSFDQRTTPVLNGHVVSVSADAYTDERIGFSYYEAEVALDTGERDRLNQALIPGMPVQTFIRTEDRTVLSFFVKPLSDYFVRAFRAG